MSRTRHHRNQRNAHCGHDLWSRRPNGGACYNKHSRTETVRRERQAERKMKHDAMRGFDVRGSIPGE